MGRVGPISQFHIMCPLAIGGGLLYDVCGMDALTATLQTIHQGSLPIERIVRSARARHSLVVQFVSDISSRGRVTHGPQELHGRKCISPVKSTRCSAIWVQSPRVDQCDVFHHAARIGCSVATGKARSASRCPDSLSFVCSEVHICAIQISGMWMAPVDDEAVPMDVTR